MEEINLDTHFDTPDTPSVNFGSGIELLMNDRKKPTSSEHISLEDELKEMENFGKVPEVKKMSFTVEKKVEKVEPIFIAKETVSMDTVNQNLGGFKHIDNIPIEEETKKIDHRTKEELLKDKFHFLRKLEALEAKGVTLSRRYSMDSSLDEMRGEYEYILAEKERKNSVQFQGKVLTTLITGLEFLNSKVDPFDIKLDGWSEQISENINDYDEIF